MTHKWLIMWNPSNDSNESLRNIPLTNQNSYTSHIPKWVLCVWPMTHIISHVRNLIHHITHNCESSQQLANYPLDSWDMQINYLPNIVVRSRALGWRLWLICLYDIKFNWNANSRINAICRERKWEPLQDGMIIQKAPISLTRYLTQNTPNSSLNNIHFYRISACSQTGEGLLRSLLHFLYR